MTTVTTPETVEPAGGAPRPAPLGVRMLRQAGRFTILWLLIILAVVLSLTSPHFLSSGNIESILRQASFVGIAGAGMTILMVAGDFDLSIGSMLAVCSIAAASAVPLLGLPGGLLAGVATGVVLAIVNGLIVTRLRVPTLVATLGTMYVFLALGFIVSGGSIKAVTDESYLLLNFVNVGPLPLSFVIALIVFAVCGAILHLTSFGRLVRAVGTSAPAAIAAGIPVRRVRMVAFVVVGVCVAIAGFLQTAQLSSASPTVGTGFELNVIAAVVLGGTSLSGGRGTLFGSLCGALFFAVLNNGMNLWGVGSYWQYVATGGVVIVALALDSGRTVLERRAARA
jgi:ribose/xylose/arabinose/galactoside ABC-type transport system permease subunit